MSEQEIRAIAEELLSILVSLPAGRNYQDLIQRARKALYGSGAPKDTKDE